MRKHNAPTLRVEGFDDKWENGTFEGYGHGLVGYSFDSSEFSKNGVKLVRGMNVKRGYLDFEERIDMRWPSSEGLEKYLLAEGDIVIAMDGLVGTSLAKIDFTHLPALLVQRVFRMRPRNADSDFAYQSVVRGFAQHARLMQTSTTIAHLTSKDIGSFPVVFPPTLAEQQAIGSIFSNLDAAIHQHMLKHKTLQQAKTALMQRMFSQEGQTVPELRLEGFDGEWVEKKLVDEVSFYSGLTYSPHDVAEHGGVLVLRSSNVHGGRITMDDCVFVRSESVNVHNVCEGDIIMVVRNGSRALIGKHAVVQQSMPETVIGAFMTGIRTPQPSFFSALFSTDLFDYEVAKSIGATINQITGAMFAKMHFFIPPTFEEQQAIGTVFAKLDALIAAQAEYITKLTQTKAALLQRMFV